MPINYTKRNWTNAPSTATPLNATNLEAMDAGIKAACDGLDALQADGGMQTLLASPSIKYRKKNGVVEVFFEAGTVATPTTYTAIADAVLPVGFRPPQEIRTSLALPTAYGYLSIATNGTMAWSTNAAVQFSACHVTYVPA